MLYLPARWIVRHGPCPRARAQGGRHLVGTSPPAVALLAPAAADATPLTALAQPLAHDSSPPDAAAGVTVVGGGPANATWDFSVPEPRTDWLVAGTC